MEIKEVPIEVMYFADRKSRVAGSIAKYAIKTASIIFRCYRDYFPLRFFWSIAAICAVPAVFLLIIFSVHYWRSGTFTGYLFAGFGSAFMFGMSTIFFVLGIVTDMLDRIRTNQERVLYLLKKKL